MEIKKDARIDVRTTDIIKSKSEVVAKGRGLNDLTTLIEYKLLEEIQKWEDEFGTIRLAMTSRDMPDTLKIGLVITIREMQKKTGIKPNSINSLLIKKYEDLTVMQSALLREHRKLLKAKRSVTHPR